MSDEKRPSAVDKLFMELEAEVEQLKQDRRRLLCEGHDPDDYQFQAGDTGCVLCDLRLAVEALASMRKEIDRLRAEKEATK